MRSYYLSVISGERRGIVAALLRLVLGAGTGVYRLLHGGRRLLYRAGVLRSHRLAAPVVSVGNLTAGGTGKTPLVEWIARWFARRQCRVAVLARGYGRIEGTGRDDEDLFAEMDLENVVRLAGRDRVASGRRAVGEYKADVLLLDDGFQHYRVRRALDLVAVDATRPFSNGRVLPRGLLREPPEALRRADLVVLTRTDQVAPEVLDGLRKRVGPAVETVHRPVHLRQLGSKKRLELDWLKSRPFLGFCGLGNPEAFRKTLEGLGGNLVKFRAFEDHRAYDAGDARRLAAEAEEFMAEALVTTEKDATKLRAESFPLPVLALRVEIEVVRNEDLLEERLQAVVRDLPRAAAAPIGR